MESKHALRLPVYGPAPEAATATPTPTPAVQARTSALSMPREAPQPGPQAAVSQRAASALPPPAEAGHAKRKRAQDHGSEEDLKARPSEPATEAQRYVLGAAMDAPARERLHAERSRSKVLNALCATLESGSTLYTFPWAGMAPGHLAHLVQHVTGLLAGPAISTPDLNRLLYACSHWRVGDEVFQTLLDTLGGAAISPERLRQLVEARLEGLHQRQSGQTHRITLHAFMKQLGRAGVLTGPRQDVVLRCVLTHPHVSDTSLDALLAHLAPEGPMDDQQRARWEADAGGAIALVAHLVHDSYDARLGVFEGLSRALEKAQQWHEVSHLWRLAMRGGMGMPPRVAAVIATGITFGKGPFDPVAQVRQVLSAADLPGARAVLPLAFFRIFAFAQPLHGDASAGERVESALRELAAQLAALDPILQLGVWLAWHQWAQRIPQAQAEPAAVSAEAAALDARDLSDPALCRPLLADPLAALTHPALATLDRFEAMAVACAVRGSAPVPGPELGPDLPAPVRDELLLRYPSLLPWAIAAADLPRLHAHFMARIQGDPEWRHEIGPQPRTPALRPSTDRKSAAAGTRWPHAPQEVAGFYDAFLQACGLQLAGPEPFPHDPPARARRKAIELVAALQPLVRQGRAATGLHPFERSRLHLFETVLARLTPAAAIDRAIDAACARPSKERPAAFERLSTEYALTAPDPAGVVRHVLDRTWVLETDINTASETVQSLLLPFTSWPRGRSVALLRGGLMPPVLQGLARHDPKLPILLLQKIQPVTDRLGQGALTLLDAALDPQIELHRHHRMEVIEELLRQGREAGESVYESMRARIDAAPPSDDPWLERRLMQCLLEARG